MKFFRKHWYDIAGLFAVFALAYLYFVKNLTQYEMIMWLSLVSLFCHQMEEYRIAGTFPGMINSVLFKSELPDRYPLNTNTALCINVLVGWLTYFLAALFAEKVIWLGIATMLISLGNTIAHTSLFNIKGKTMYNAGMATSLVFFVPLIYFFFVTIHQEHLATITDYLIGIPLGIVLNVFGILKPIQWLADKHTTYIFEQRNLLPKDRKSSTVEMPMVS